MSTVLANACVCSLLLTTAVFAGENQPCRLRHGLYAELTRLEREYNAPEENTALSRQQILDNLALIDKEYSDFLQSSAEAAVQGDDKSLQVCTSLAKGDPLASQLVALVLYLHNGRKDAASFVASFPANKQQLTNFWNLDEISTGGTTEVPTSIPGISLPDGLVDKYITELFSLAVNGDPEAMRKYVYLYEAADGGYAEFMEDQAATFFNEHSDTVVREWPLFSPLGKRLAADEAATTGDYTSIVKKLRKRCGRRQDQSCAEILKLFH